MNSEHSQNLLVKLLRNNCIAFSPAPLLNLTLKDWSDLIECSRLHGVTPLIYNRLTQTKTIDLLPDKIREKLRAIYLYSGARNTSQYHELNRLLMLFKKNQISVIVLKGAHLAEIIYDNIALRPMTDLDILVYRSELLKAVQLVLDHGYRIENPKIQKIWFDYQSADHEILPESKHFPDLIHHEKKIRLDIHCSIVPEESPFTVNMDDLWKRTENGRIGEMNALVLGPEDLMTYLSFHSAYLHQFRAGLRDLYDLVRILEYYGKRIDWPTLQLRAKEWKMTKCLYLTLNLVVKIFDVKLPETFLEKIKPKDYNDKLLERAELAVFNIPKFSQDESLVFIRFWHTKNFMRKFKLLFNSIFPPRTVMSQMYPASPDSLRILIYYPVRLIDLFSRYIKTVCQRIFLRKSSPASIKDKILIEDWLRSE